MASEAARLKDVNMRVDSRVLDREADSARESRVSERLFKNYRFGDRRPDAFGVSRDEHDGNRFMAADAADSFNAGTIRQSLVSGHEVGTARFGEPNCLELRCCPDGRRISQLREFILDHHGYDFAIFDDQRMLHAQSRELGGSRSSQPSMAPLLLVDGVKALSTAPAKPLRRGPGAMKSSDRVAKPLAVHRCASAAAVHARGIAELGARR